MAERREEMTVTEYEWLKKHIQSGATIMLWDARALEREIARYSAEIQSAEKSKTADPAIMAAKSALVAEMMELKSIAKVR